MMARRGHRASLVAVALVVALLVAAVSVVHPCRAAEPKKVAIGPKDYCAACQAGVELFFKLTMEQVQKARRSRGVKVDATNTMNHLCDRPEFSVHYSERIKYGCQKVVTEHPEEVFASFNGEHDKGNFEEIYRHKQKVCVEIDACKAKEVESTLSEQTPCGACKAIAGDIERIMDWERDTKDKKRMRKVIASVCDDLGLRHTDADREFLEEYCDEVLEEIPPSSIAGTIKLRKQLSSNGMQLTNTLAEKLCSEMSDYCPKPKANDEDSSSKEEEL